MPIVQQNTGVFNGTSFTASLTAASDAANCVILVVAGNTTVTTPASWNLRASQVNFMGHYWFDLAGSVTSVAVSNAAGQGTWVMAEIAAGTFDVVASANAAASNTTYTTPTTTPTAGVRIVLASVGSVATGGASRTITAWNSSFLEIADLCQTTGATDAPMQGVAIRDALTVNGSTGFSTQATFSAASTGRTAIIAAYVTSTAVALPPIIVMPPRRP